MDVDRKFLLRFRLNYDERQILISFLKLCNMAFEDWTKQYPSRADLMCGKYFNYTQVFLLFGSSKLVGVGDRRSWFHDSLNQSMFREIKVT